MRSENATAGRDHSPGNVLTSATQTGCRKRRGRVDRISLATSVTSCCNDPTLVTLDLWRAGHLHFEAAARQRPSHHLHRPSSVRPQHSPCRTAQDRRELSGLAGRGDGHCADQVQFGNRSGSGRKGQPDARRQRRLGELQHLHAGQVDGHDRAKVLWPRQGAGRDPGPRSSDVPSSRSERARAV